MASLRTDRLLLRPARRDDLAAFHALLTDERVMRYWSTLPHASLAETEAWLAAMIVTPPDAGEDFVVELDGRAIGKAGLHRFPEIGFAIMPDCWGRGLAREAVAAVLNRAFGHHGLPAVTADVDPRNRASLGLLARLGFVETGRATANFRVGDQWFDSVYLRRDRPVSGSG
jgi:RimJ/RimL family protein N-acetyltransferase